MYKLVSFNLCPYVQRTVIVLNEKGVPYEVEYIDLRQKPAWFLAMSPTGKVPVVQTPEGVNLFESGVINDYLDELHAPTLLPEAPLARAQDRMWRDFMVDLYGLVSPLYYSATRADAEQALAELRAKLLRFEAAIVGPYFWGERFSMVDVAAAPPLMRLAWVEERAPDIVALDGLPKLAAWRTALLARPSVQSSVLPEIRSHFAEALRRRGSWLVAKAAALE